MGLLELLFIMGPLELVYHGTTGASLSVIRYFTSYSFNNIISNLVYICYDSFYCYDNEW